MFRRSKNPVIPVRALKDIDLVAQEGDRLGVIGHNGAGKSSLLRLLAGIYPPVSGQRRVSGRISSLFDLVQGFEPDADGWENIAFRGYLQGESPKSLRGKIPQIAEFSELGSFLDLPVRYYSAGMLVRLAFSIATAIDPQILLVDEVLSAGDLSFQAKARIRMREMMDKADILVLVSHDLDAIVRLCTHVIWLDHGAILREGAPDDIVRAYIQHMNASPKLAA
jgi:ABC-type polysaccharide/polyol phosphate transport system ATPase subunit